MKNNDKTREQLLKELEKSNKKIAELEKSETVHKQAEETLRESDKRYKNLYSMMRLMSDNLPDLIWTKDMEGKFLFVNKACSEILLDAEDTDEPIGKTDIYFAQRGIDSHPENPDYFTFGKTCTDSDLAVLNSKKPLRFDESGNVKGKFLFLDVFKAPFYGENGNIMGTVGCAKVVTKERQLEKELQESEKKLSQIIEGSSTPIFVIDKNHIVTHWNKACEKLTGVSAEKITNTKKHWIPFYSTERPLLADVIVDNLTEKEIAKFYNNKFKKSALIEGAYDCEDFYPDLDNKWLFFTAAPLRDNQGNISGAIETLRDITEQKQAEELLKKSEARLRQIIDTLPHMIFAKDRDGRFIMANKTVADGCGTTPENMVGKIHPELLGAAPEQYESYLTDDREVIDSGKLKFIPEEDYTHPDGRKVIMETTKIPFTSAGIPAVLGVSIDITERKKAEEELKKHREHLEELVKERTKELKTAQEELVRKEQLAILGQFSGSISHELRNPLAVIDSSIYYLKMKLKESDKTVHQHLERIGSSVNSSTTIIDSLLSLTRMKKPEMSRNNLISLVSDSIKNTKMPDKVKVIQDFPDKEISVNIEYEQCRMALKNIINNACEAMDNNGTLTVTIRKIKKNSVEVSFKDTGYGIAPENIDKIFLPLFSTKTRGIGFGLSITKMIIENHGGTLKVKSEQGKGANFIISLPLL